MKKESLVLIAVAVLTVSLFAFAGCGDKQTTATAPASTTTTISTTTQGSQAASTGTQSADMATGSTSTMDSLSQMGITSLVGSGAPAFKPATPINDKGLALTSRLASSFADSAQTAQTAAFIRKQMVSASATNTVSITNSCADGGSRFTTGTLSNTASAVNFYGTVIFNSCSADNARFDGTFILNGTLNLASLSFSIVENAGVTGSPLVIKQFDPASSYATQTAIMNAVMTLGITIANDTTLNPNRFTTTLVANGLLQATDNITNDNFNITYNNMNQVYFLDWITGLNVRVNGGFTENWSNGTANKTVAVSYQNFALTFKTYPFLKQEDMTINGTYSINVTPDTCFEGTFQFTTTIPVKYDYLNKKTIAGDIIVNGNVAVHYNSDGSITVTLTGGSPQNFTPSQLAVCEFGTL